MDFNSFLADNLYKQFAPKPFDTLIVFLKECFETVYFEKSQHLTTKA